MHPARFDFFVRSSFNLREGACLELGKGKLSWVLWTNLAISIAILRVVQAPSWSATLLENFHSGRVKPSLEYGMATTTIWILIYIYEGLKKKLSIQH
ncbi:unnamed protein product [Blepharisma stoltei]|uniref:Uncharacterized protein n=1 Tax=Blepharisma stoltei TaxID=1481888 RepID=A0AAU9JN52_9CILI|nr:unnamed protein product [Blepharisma stoltei]